LKKYGEFKCNICDAIFFTDKQLSGHMGGAHRRNASKEKKIICKKCGDKLIADKNWPKWAVEQGNMICKKCKNIQNKKSYRNNKANKTRK